MTQERIVLPLAPSQGSHLQASEVPPTLPRWGLASSLPSPQTMSKPWRVLTVGGREQPSYLGARLV